LLSARGISGDGQMSAPGPTTIIAQNAHINGSPRGSRGGVSVAPYQVNRPRLDDKGHLLIAASQEDIVVLASSFGSANK